MVLITTTHFQLSLRKVRESTCGTLGLYLGKIAPDHSFRVHRKVKKGSEIIVGMKDAEEKENKRKRRTEESKINLKDAAMELMSVVVSAFTVITMAQNL